MSVGDWFAKVKLNHSVQAEADHALIAYASVLTFHKHPLIAAVGIALVALFLELYFDPRYERHENVVRPEDLRDFAWYLFGAAVGLLYVMFFVWVK